MYNCESIDTDYDEDVGYFTDGDDNYYGSDGERVDSFIAQEA